LDALDLFFFFGEGVCCTGKTVSTTSGVTAVGAVLLDWIGRGDCVFGADYG